MKKILIDLERLKYPNTGIATVFENLAKGLVKKPSKFSFYFFGPKKKLLTFTDKNHVIIHSPIFKFFDFFSQKYDLIHVSHQLSSYFQKNYSTTKKIVTLHDLNFLKENFNQKKVDTNIQKVNNNLKHADYIVCISNFVKQDFLENKHLFELEKLKDIFVIYNGIQIPEERTYDLGKFDFLGNKKYILNIGVLFPKKNQILLLDLVKNIEEDLVLIVSEEKQSYLEKFTNRMKELKIENKVHLLRHVSNEEKYALIQNCTAMVHPSIAEGFGVPPIEAMLFGKPVFLNNKTSLPEIGGDLAYYFEDLEPSQMLEVYKNGLLHFNQNYEQKSADYKNWGKQFSVENMTSKYLEVYDLIISND